MVTVLSIICKYRRHTVKFKWRWHYLSVISASGCEAIVMNQTAPKNSDQNVSQQIQNIAATHATPPPGLWRLIRCFRIADGLNTTTREIGTSVPVFGLRAIC
jgi:hypothetical protein